jgi:hypothetical protein
MTYQVVKKSSKHDNQGNLLRELWLKDSRGGYSLLRTSGEEFDALTLGEVVTVTITASQTETVRQIEVACV